ncbi:MAG: diphosphate--fructose-6-phosphate 1-phosphotransferase, partial [Bacteroidetes bacterium]|nr:diphosphate--fructose-6-phosphate 1-phosphotransferase [Bacteroidota bacterium]
VINASLQGVIEEALKYPQFDNILGARFGIEGLLNERFIDLRAQPQNIIEKLQYIPASVLGSCRKKLTYEYFPRVLDILKVYGIRYFFYNGGNGSMDTCNKISKLAVDSGYDLNVIGIPKTIDNDLVNTDHCPGYGSAARYVAVSMMELACDIESLPIHICVAEIMGRNTGWLTAAASLAAQDNKGPHLIYLPERPLILPDFLNDVKEMYDMHRGVLVVVSEGLKDEKGQHIADSGFTDGFGHKVPGGVSQYLSNQIIQHLGIRSRNEKPGLLGRSSITHQSKIDRKEAKMVGAFAVKSAVEGENGYMVSLRRISNDPYECEMGLVSLEKVANFEKTFPKEWINSRGTGISKDFVDYCIPLLGETLPEYLGLEKIYIDKR